MAKPSDSKPETVGSTPTSPAKLINMKHWIKQIYTYYFSGKAPLNGFSIQQEAVGEHSLVVEISIFNTEKSLPTVQQFINKIK